MFSLFNAFGQDFPLVHFDSEVLSGEVLTVFIEGDLDTPPGGQIGIKGTKIVTAFFHGALNRWVVILPIPMGTATGHYLITITADGKNREFTTHVTTRERIAEEIPLDSPMSTLRTSDNPEKAEQSRKLWATISEVNPEAIYALGEWNMPLEEIRVTSDYSKLRTYLYSDGETDSTTHWGIDLAGAVGTQIMSPAPGLVVFAGERILTGNTVIIEHLPAVFTMYYHLDTLDVEEGDRVIGSTVIGTVGKTGLVTGPHLHWELRVNTIPIDPFSVIPEGITHP